MTMLMGAKRRRRTVRMPRVRMEDRELRMPRLRRERRKFSMEKMQRMGRREESWFDRNAMAVQVPLAVVAGLIMGTIMSLMFDPHSGRRRRALARDKMVKLWHRTGRWAGRTTRYTTGLIRGKTMAALNAMRPHHYDNSDHVVLDRIESIVFRDPAVPKGSVNIDVVNGRAELRGALEDPYWIDELEKRVRAVPGVHDVENLLHPVGTEAPNTLDAIEASNHALQEQPLPQY